MFPRKYPTSPVLSVLCPCPHLVLLLFLAVLPSAEGHGRLLEPPSRASMWRLGFNTPINYNDNQLFCGGYQRQWLTNKGKCGVCGDPWDGRRDHEAGGEYSTGTIVRKYPQGGTMDITVELTANHYGYFEFRLCPHNNPQTPVTQDCLDRHPLKLSDDKRRFHVTSNRTGMYKMKVRLPAEVTCSQCVLQWKYNAGNSWRCDHTGLCCIGCGPQEQFYGCADIAIPTSTAETNAIATDSSSALTSKCSANGLWSGNAHMVTWCKVNCAMGNCPRALCSAGCRSLVKDKHTVH